MIVKIREKTTTHYRFVPLKETVNQGFTFKAGTPTILV
jgi:hypothetical protein